MATDLNTIILNSIKNESKYGLEIIEEIKRKTNNRVVLKQPSLYSALRRLEAKGYVTSYWEGSVLGGKRHYYKATPLGVEALNNKISFQDAADEYINEPNQKPSHNDNIFPNIRPNGINTDFNDEVFDDDEPETLDSPVNYKSILGDFLTDENEDEVNIDEKIAKQPQTIAKKDQPTSVPKEKMESQSGYSSSAYIKELNEMFKNDNKNNKKSPPQENTTPTPTNMDLLESIAKKYNENFSKQKNNQSAEDVEIQLIDNINKKKNVTNLDIKRNEHKYLYINQINFVSGLCIFFINLSIYLTMFLLYDLKGWMTLVDYIIMGSALLISIILVLIDIFSLLKHPNKKINKKIKWGKKFAIRIFAFVLLFVFIVAVNLLAGMENLASLTKVHYLNRWFIPTMLIFGIILRVILNLIISKQEKYQI